MSGIIDVYVRDKLHGGIHKVGSNPHDHLYVDSDGQVCYENMQNGDGTGDGDEYGYEFVKIETGVIHK